MTDETEYRGTWIPGCHRQRKRIIIEIETVPAADMDLMDDAFCMKEGQRLYNWMIQNVPHGVFQEFLEACGSIY